MPEEESLETLLRTQDLPELMVVKGLLESAGIPYEVQGEIGLGMMSLSGTGLFGGRGSEAILRVRRADLEAALGLLRAPVPDLDESEG